MWSAMASKSVERHWPLDSSSMRPGPGQRDGAREHMVEPVEVGVGRAGAGAAQQAHEQLHHLIERGGLQPQDAARGRRVHLGDDGQVVEVALVTLAGEFEGGLHIGPHDAGHGEGVARLARVGLQSLAARGVHIACAAADHRHVQASLRGEVVVQQAGVDVGGLADVLGADAVEAVAGEQRLGRVEEPLLRFPPAFFVRPPSASTQSTLPRANLAQAIGLAHLLPTMVACEEMAA